MQIKDDSNFIGCTRKNLSFLKHKINNNCKFIFYN